MTSNPPPVPLLDDAHVAFVERHVSIVMAARDAHNVPAMARAIGCRVSPDRRQVTLFLPVAPAEALLKNLRDNGVAAVVFSRPSTHESIQLKGVDAAIVPLEPGDRAWIAAYQDSFVADAVLLGHAEALVRAVVTAELDATVGVRFTPISMFAQTPGPGAGRRLRGAA